MGLFDRKPRSRVFTGEEIVNLIMLAAAIDSVEQIGMQPNLQMNSVIAKCKLHVQRTEYPDGSGTHFYCPPIEIAG